MDYGDIIKRSWRITWRYKALWVLGIFAGVSGCQAGGGSGGNSGGSGGNSFQQFGDGFSTASGSSGSWTGLPSSSRCSSRSALRLC